LAMLIGALRERESGHGRPKLHRAQHRVIQAPDCRLLR
jgi:hypothetical protein